MNGNRQNSYMGLLKSSESVEIKEKENGKKKKNNFSLERITRSVTTLLSRETFGSGKYRLQK